MLIEIRDRASGIVAYFIVGLLVISFALWGIQEYFGNSSEPLVAEVDGIEITQREFNRRLQEQSRYLRSVLGNSFDTIYANDDVLKNEILDSLIENALLQKRTEEMGFRVNDYEVLQYLQALPYFQNNGRFDVNRYEQVLSAQGISAKRFEEQLRQDQAITQFRTSIRVSSLLTNVERLELAQLNEQKRNFAYLQIPPPIDNVEVNDEQIAAFYDQNKTIYQNPARVKLEYLEIDQNTIADDFVVSDEDLRLDYESNPERFRDTELRQVRRILLKLEEGADAERVQEKLAELEAIKSRIEGGEDFAALATEYSEDKFSANKGGDLGLISAEDFEDPEFNRVAFSMQEGQISAPVRTRFGVQLIEVTDTQTGELKSFEQAKEEIETELRQQFAQKAFFQLAEELDHLTYENDDNLNVAADELGLKVQQTDWLTAESNEGIMQIPAVQETAFSDELIESGLNSAVIEPGDGRALVIRVAAYQKAEPKTLQEVREQVKQALVNEKARAENKRLTDQWVNQLRAGEINLEQLATQESVQVETSGLVLRDDAKVPSEIVAEAFRMTRPESGISSYDQVLLENGSRALIRLDEVVQSDTTASAVESSEWSVYATQYGQREMNAVLKTIRDSADVRLYPENI